MKTIVPHAWIDVTEGRKTMERDLKAGPIKVTLEGYITEPSSRDDGTSVMFYVNPTSVKVFR